MQFGAGVPRVQGPSPGMSKSGPVESRDFLGKLGALGCAFVGIVGADVRQSWGAYSYMYL